MSEEHTIEIEIGGAQREVTLSRPQGFEFLHAVATMPDGLGEVGEGNDLDTDDIDWLMVLVERTTDLSREEMNRVAVKDLDTLIEASAKVFAGEDPTTSTDDFRLQKSDDPFEGLDLNEDGSVDPDDWR